MVPESSPALVRLKVAGRTPDVTATGGGPAAALARRVWRYGWPGTASRRAAGINEMLGHVKVACSNVVARRISSNCHWVSPGTPTTAKAMFVTVPTLESNLTAPVAGSGCPAV